MGSLFVAVATFLASFVTFYSAFGLGTILMPVMAIFVPVPLAIVMTALIHLLHNLLKSIFLWNFIEWKIAFRFGGVALIAAIPGALLLRYLAELSSIKSYTLFGIDGEVTWIKITIGLLLMFIATNEILPKKVLKMKNPYLGGGISGFFGGLSGNQGAFRSAFLLQFQKDKKSFIATNAIIATAVDVMRSIIYLFSFQYIFQAAQLSVLTMAVIGAVLGIVVGLLLLKKITIHFIQKLVVVLLYILAVLMVLGFI